MQTRAWAAMLIAALGWGTGAVATRGALEEGVPPYALVTWRSILATLLVVAWLALRRRRPATDRRTLTTGTVMGVANLAAPWILSTLAVQYASAGFVGLQTALIPAITAVLAHFALPDEPLRAGKIAGLLVALAGVAVLLLSGDSGLETGGRPVLAFVLALAAILSIAFASVYAKQQAGNYDPVEMTGLQFGIGAIIIVAAMLIAEGPSISYSTEGWSLVVYMAVAASFLPFLLFFWVIRHVTVTKVSLIGYIVPVIAVVAGVLFLDERLQPGLLAGGALILIGVVITDRAEHRFAAQRAGLVVPEEATR